MISRRPMRCADVIDRGHDFNQRRSGLVDRGYDAPKENRDHRVRVLVRSMALAVVTATAGCALVMGDRDALWHVVHDVCVPDQRTWGRPEPCEEVDLSQGERDGWAVVRDPNASAHVLLVPTRRIEGIESAELLSPDVPNYWHAAWEARVYVFAEVGHPPLPRDAIAMAVNSAFTRSQDQLHIHVACVRPEVHNALREHQAGIAQAWAPFPVPLAGQHFQARRVLSPDLAGVDPFRMLSAFVAATGGGMAAETLVVTGADFADGPGFLLLAAHPAEMSDAAPAHGEDLLDLTCSSAKGEYAKSH